MNLVSETSHLSEVEEDEDGQEEGDDGHCVPQEEDEDPPLLHCPSPSSVQWMIQTVSVVCIVVPFSFFQADFADVVLNIGRNHQSNCCRNYQSKAIMM